MKGALGLSVCIARAYPLPSPTAMRSASTVPGFVDDHVHDLAEKIGFDVETLEYTLGMFLCYPLGIIMQALPYGKIRHIFSFLGGAFLLQFTIRIQWIHHLITSLAVYVMFLLLPRKVSKIAVPIFVMVYMTLGHLHRQYVNYLGWDLDFTGTQMVLTQKLYMMAYNLYDGEVLAEGRENRASKKCAKFALKDLPNIIEYLGYTFCFSNILAGPAFEYTTYAHAIDGSLLYAPDGKPRGKIPSNVIPTLKPFLASLIFMGLYVVLHGMFPLLDPIDPQKNTPALLKPDFLARPWIERYAYMWIALLGVRQKYYFAWKNAEGALNIWYAGFEGFDENGNPLGWENGDNVHVLKFELAPNVQTLSREWNKKTSLWLNRYVYIRTNGNLGAVYSMSAFWHGFYPGYYLFFLSVPLLTFCERLGRKKISPYFSSSNFSAYGILCTATTSFFVEYMVSAFQMLALDWALGVWRSNYYFGHIGCILFYIIMSQAPSPKTTKKKKE